MSSYADLAGATERLGCGLTRSDSDSSAITVDASEDLGMVKTTEWTNEKHSRYLASLEASFVNELYHSINLRNFGTKKNTQIPRSSEQAAVLRDEHPKKINCEINEPLLDSTADSREVIGSPRLPNFTYFNKVRSMTYSDAQEHVMFRGKLKSRKRISEPEPIGEKCHRDLVSSRAEVSDQNFVDISGGSSSRQSTAKRLKTAASNCSSKNKTLGCHELMSDPS